MHPRRAADAAVPASDFCGANRQGSEPLPWRIVHRLMAGCRHWRHLRAENHLMSLAFLSFKARPAYDPIRKRGGITADLQLHAFRVIRLAAIKCLNKCK